MSRPVIISCAITGPVATKDDNPALPVSPAEQIESTHAAFEAGATIVHLHVRDDAGRPTGDIDRFARVLEGVRTHCPGMIVEFATGGRGEPSPERQRLIALRPDLATLTPGSVNFPGEVFANAPDAIEKLAATMLDGGVKPVLQVFDLAMLYNVRALADQGLLREPLQVQFVLGIPNALPARRQVLDFMIAELHDLCPTAVWFATGVGRHLETVVEWALYLGGHIRTGLEDTLRVDRGRMAASNAELVSRAATRCMEYGAHAATPAEARGLLGLPPAAVASAS
ncbi:3-keto-5-aminohexanoate cleavage protein [Novispirillum sp. DQ9]|uniref:3-keto-5-aminohexanoate cleavage protein n=1 Tax=Novispirillum sp. DQ9 TaxID=3398612 RepID=UPI003C79CD57